MDAVEIIEAAKGRELFNEEGEPEVLELQPGVSAKEISNLEADLRMSLPDSYKALMAYTRGFDLFAEVDFAQGMGPVEMSDFCHLWLTIAADGFGNFWVIDLTDRSEGFGPVYFHCHDAPVFLFQCRTVEEFLEAIFALGTNSAKNTLTGVYEDRFHDVWSKNPGLIGQPAAVTGEDPILRDFASQLDERWWIKDIRNPKPGDGFSWGRYGPETEVKRFGKLPIFAVREPERRRGFFEKLFGGGRK
jgi:cell wall assembly regulator SMI1